MTVSSAGVDTPASPSLDIAHLAQRFSMVRRHWNALAAPLEPGETRSSIDAGCQPDEVASRSLTTWFFEEFVLSLALADYEQVDPSYQYLFNSYYEAVGARQPRPRRGMITRPSVSDIIADYRAQVDGAMGALLAERAEDPAFTAVVDPSLIELGTHRRQQHQELLLMDIRTMLFQNPLHPAYESRLVEASEREASPVTFKVTTAASLRSATRVRTSAYDNGGLATRCGWSRSRWPIGS